MRSALFKSTPWRLTLSLGLAALVVLALSGMLALALIGDELGRRTDQDLRDRLAIVAKAYEDGDATDLIETVSSFEQVNADGQHPIALVDANGTVLAGDRALASAMSDGTTGSMNLRIGDQPFRAVSGPVGRYSVRLAAADQSTDELVNLMRDGLLRAGLLLAAIVLALGVAVAVHGQRRLQRLAATLAQVGAGNLDARFALSRRDDDIDQLCAQVNAMLDQLQASMQRVREVTTDIAHDLKTPLTRLVLALEDVSMRLDPASAEGRTLAAALGDAFGLNRSFEALLRLSQVEAGLGRDRKRMVDIGSLLARLRDAYEEVFSETDRRLEVTASDKLPRLPGDEDLLGQMLSNLLENALRHTPRGTRVVLGAETTASELVLVVADDGPGIAATDRDRIFERHFRADTARAGGGLGIGLSLVRAVAAFHDGTVVVEDNEPGARFIVRMPLRQALAAEGRRDTGSDGDQVTSVT